MTRNHWRYSSAVVVALCLGICGTNAVAETPAHAVQTNFPGVYAVTQPPAEFSPLTASDEALHEWGFPPRPAASQGPQAMALWTQAVTAKVQRVIPQLKVHPGVYHRPVRDLRLGATLGHNTASTSSNWSGVALIPGSGDQAYYLVEAAWSVPTVKQAPGTCSGGWDYSSEWVGIGGFADAYLYQAGSAANVYCDVGNNIPEYFPWIEWLPAAELVLYENASTETLYPFQPGDYIIVEVWATAFSGGVSKTGNLLYEDITQGWSISLTNIAASSLGGSEVTGKSVEWIVERTEVGGKLATLPDYIADPWVATAGIDLGKVYHYPGAAGTSAVYNITMLDNNNSAESYEDGFGKNSLWFFPEGSATK